jgi:hypothetical protein
MQLASRLKPFQQSYCINIGSLRGKIVLSDSFDFFQAAIPIMQLDAIEEK